jgi:hypothetical protein
MDPAINPAINGLNKYPFSSLLACFSSLFFFFFLSCPFFGSKTEVDWPEVLVQEPAVRLAWPGGKLEDSLANAISTVVAAVTGTFAPNVLADAIRGVARGTLWRLQAKEKKKKQKDDRGSWEDKEKSCWCLNFGFPISEKRKRMHVICVGLNLFVSHFSFSSFFPHFFLSSFPHFLFFSLFLSFLFFFSRV